MGGGVGFKALLQLANFTLGSLYANRISVLRIASGPWMKSAGCKSALKSAVIYSTDRS